MNLNSVSIKRNTSPFHAQQKHNIMQFEAFSFFSPRWTRIVSQYSRENETTMAYGVANIMKLIELINWGNLSN